MPKYMVHMKIQGHASIEVEAENETAAIKEAAEAMSFDNIDDWDVVRRGAEAEEIN